jgi:hypothetical protein
MEGKVWSGNHGPGQPRFPILMAMNVTVVPLHHCLSDASHQLLTPQSDLESTPATMTTEQPMTKTIVMGLKQLGWNCP